MNPRRFLTLLSSLAITVLFLVLALRPVDFAEVARAFAAADYRLVLLAGAFTFSGYMFRTARWRRLLAPARPVPLTLLFPILIIGFALNNVLPGRPGEFARAYALGARTGLSKTLGLGTVVVERVLDGITLLLFLLVTFAAFVPLGLQLPPLVQTSALLVTLLFVTALAALFFLLLREAFALSLFHAMARFLPARLASRLEQMLGSFTLGLHALKSPGDLAAVSLFSVAVWLSESISYLIFLTAFGALPDLPLRATAAVFAMVTINLGILIPAAPGGLGPFEAAAVFALGVFGMNETAAASVALAAHGVQYLLITSLGLFFVWRTGISLADTRAE